MRGATNVWTTASRKIEVAMRLNGSIWILASRMSTSPPPAGSGYADSGRGKESSGWSMTDGGPG